MIYLSVIIPAYNEEKRLKTTAGKVVDFLKTKKHNSEIIIVDDGSTDRTVASISEIASKENTIKIITNSKNRGKGYAVRKGVEVAEGEVILFSDADLSTPIEELEKLLEQMYKFDLDIAVGSRALKESQVIIHQPFYRELMGKIFNKIARVFTFKKIYDSQCGFKLFKKDAAKKIFSLTKIDGFAFDAEVIFIAQKLGFNIKEVPVRWYNNPQTKVKAIKDSIKMLIDIIRIRYYYWKGCYNL